MSLAKKLKLAQTKAANRGCQSCKWWAMQTSETKALINEWLDADRSSMQLHGILSSDSDNPTEVLRVSYSAWQSHLKHHDEMFRESK